MIGRNQIYFWSDKYIVFKGNTASVHKSAGMIDKYIFTYVNILSKIGIKRWNDKKSIVNFFAD